jgi:hypothetical protein
MRRHLSVFIASLAVGLLGLGLIVNARPGNASGQAPAAAAAPAATPAAKEPGEPAPRLAASRLLHVTVYPDSALVTREVEVPAGTGLIELVVNPLPHATVASSLYTEASDGLRVLTTRFRSRPVLEDTREEVRKVEEEIKKLHQQQRKIQAEIKALDGNMAFMGNLEKYTAASTTNATEKGKLDSDNAIALAKYLMEGRTEKSKQLVELNEKLLDLAEQLSFAERKKSHLTSGTSKVERDAVLVVDKANAAAGKVRLNYLVTSAAWRPQYKFRAGRTAKDAVTVEYLAALVQQTGEDWDRVEMTLSTAQPMLNAAPPELHALAVAVVPRGAPMPGLTVSGLRSNLGQFGGQTGMQGGFGGGMGRPGMPGMGGMGLAPGSGPVAGQQPTQPAMGMPGGGEGAARGGRLALANPEGKSSADELNEAAKDLRRQAQETFNLRNEKDAAELANYASVLEQARDLVMMPGKKAGEVHSARATKNEGPSVTYHLPAKLSVPSRNDDQVIEVARLELEPDYFYKAVPVLSPHVYRQADLLNKSKYVLLPGEATMYQGSDFVGRMALPLVAVGERFTVGFGTEPQLQVQRQMMERSRAMQAGNQVLKYEYRILVTSYKGEKVRVQVWDRLPHAEKEAMGVSLVKTAPALCADPLYVREDRPNNLLRWDVEVDPDMRGEKAQKIQYEFQLELDRQATLGSFQTK